MKETNFIMLDGKVAAQKFLIEFLKEVYIVLKLVKTILQRFRQTLNIGMVAWLLWEKT